jgi:mRNA interferase HigB
MWIISKTALREHWESAGNEDSEMPLRAWYSIVSLASWRTFADLKDTYGNASLVGDCVVFNIAGNKYRLVTRVRFLQHKVFILQILTHGEYDKDKWKTDCGCFSSSDAAAHRPESGDATRADVPVRKKRG